MFIEKAIYAYIHENYCQVLFLYQGSLPDFYRLHICQHYIIIQEHVFLLFIHPSVLDCIRVGHAGIAFPALLYSTELVCHLSSSLMSIRFLHSRVQLRSVLLITPPCILSYKKSNSFMQSLCEHTHT